MSGKRDEGKVGEQKPKAIKEKLGSDKI